jgi:hypothetical protein
MEECAMLNRIAVTFVSVSLFFIAPVYASPDSTIVEGDLRITGTPGVSGLVYPDGSVQYSATIGISQLPIGTTADTVASGTDSRFTDSRNPTAGSSFYIQNQTVSPQAASFSISGTGCVGGILTVGGNINLPTTTSTKGIIMSGASTLLHAYGNNNFFAGLNAGNLTTTGFWNTATGASALPANSGGVANTANGMSALYNNSNGSFNTAVGDFSLFRNISGDDNTAVGSNALSNNTDGAGNTAVGKAALGNIRGFNNTAIGNLALTNCAEGNDNIVIGVGAGGNLSSGSNNIFIGSGGNSPGVESNTIRLGNSQINQTYIAGISGVTSVDGTAVYVNSNGQLGTVTSSRRFKEEIQNMGNVSDNLMKLRPVSFYYKQNYTSGPRHLQYGLIAEEVAEVYPNLVQYNENGEPNTVFYQFVNAMLLNEVQKQKQHIDQLEERLARLEALLNMK